MQSFSEQSAFKILKDQILTVSRHYFLIMVPQHLWIIPSVMFCWLFSPNESKRPRTLSKLNDTSVWERRKTKGKLAIQKMVVDLMELYLHRLKQRRLPYPKSPAMDEFAAQFPYKPTPDQKQV